LDQANDVTDAQLGIAIGRHLIEWDDRRKRYSLHDLVRAYIVDIADIEDLSMFRTRHAHYYSELCSHIDDLYRESGDSIFAALNLFDSENANIAAGFAFCADHASADESAAKVCTAFVRGLTHVMDLRLPPIVRAQVLVSGLEAAKQLGDTGLVVLHTGNLGRVYRELGEFDLALECQEWVLEMATKAGYREDQAYAHHHIGLVLLHRGDFLGGVGHLEQALNLSRDPTLSLTSLEANSLSNLGTAYLETNQPARALDYFRSAIELARELNDPRFLACTMNNLGVTLVTAQKEPLLAVEMLERALGIATDLGDQQLRFSVHAHLAQALAQAGRHDEALEIAKSQHSEAARIGYTKFEVDALQSIGDLYLASGDMAAAEASFETMLQIAHDRSDQSAQRKALGAMAQAAVHKRDKGSAIKLLEESLGLATEAREKASIAWRLGNLLFSAGNHDRAVTMTRQAMDYFAKIDHEGLDAMRDMVRRIEDGAE
jgi:tetratricopeptide (TPR) repeat protein